MTTPNPAAPPPETAYICAGSNMGDKAANCRRGIEALTGESGTRLICLSPFYRTEPVDYTDQDWFVNVMAKITTTLPPRSLLKRLKQIEAGAGRSNGGIRFGPRVLDLDIIFYGDQILENPDLVIPHPRMHKRHFVLKPICDIDPAIVHPVLNRKVGALLGELDVVGQELSIIPPAS